MSINMFSCAWGTSVVSKRTSLNILKTHKLHYIHKTLWKVLPPEDSSTFQNVVRVHSVVHVLAGNTTLQNNVCITIKRIYFWNKTLYLSHSSSVHHQEFFTVHTAMVYVIQVCWQLVSRTRIFCPDPAQETVWNMKSFIPEINLRT